MSEKNGKMVYVSNTILVELGEIKTDLENALLALEGLRDVLAAVELLRVSPPLADEDHANLNDFYQKYGRAKSKGWLKSQ